MPRTDQRLVIDASVAVKACLGPTGFSFLTPHGRLLAPHLMWSETTATIQELRWRGDIEPDTARTGLERLLTGPVQPFWSVRLFEEATEIAAQLGWAKTYDAEYVALARLLDAPLVTVDARLQRGAGSLVRILGPMDLPSLQG